MENNNENEKKLWTIDDVAARFYGLNSSRQKKICDENDIDRESTRLPQFRKPVMVYNIKQLEKLLTCAGWVRANIDGKMEWLRKGVVAK